MSNPGIGDTHRLRQRRGDSENDSDSDSESDGEVGAQAPPLTKQISNILNRYPEGGQILKELIQNADDAQATKVGFLIDWRDHPIEPGDVMFQNFEKYQGAALYAWNDAVFKKNDWHSLGKINQSSKEEDVLKVGRFGLGFQSVFHITDLPMVVSQKHIAVIDPHRKCIKPKSETSPAGTKKKLSSIFRYKGHVSAFESMFNLNTKVKKYDGTIFRFPLRQTGSVSEISTKVYTPEMIQEKLFESLKEESPYILLFLRNIKSISLFEWPKGSSQSFETFQVTAAINQMVDRHISHDEAAVPRCEVFAKQCSQSSETDDSEVYLELKSTTVSVTSYDNTDPHSDNHYWLVLKVVGTNDHELDTLGKELSILPWVGLATRLPGQIALCGCEATTTSPFDDCTTVERVFKQFQTSLERSQQSITWARENVETSTGHAYCFLPLPETTAMPVHVHGYFAVTDNRRSIKWPAHDEKGKEAQWNRELLLKMVAPAYALLLTSRATLIHYEDTPLPITNTENMTDPYSTWPLYPEVKNVPIWNELLSPTLDFALPLPLLWTSACGGKWVQFSEAYFLPGSFSANSNTCSNIVIQLLIKLDIPLVSLPGNVCETFKQNESMLKALSQNEISPQFVRDIIGRNSHCCSSLSKAEVYDILKFILLDISREKSVNLVGIHLLPLRGASDMAVFQKPTGDNNKYIFPSISKGLLGIIPGADSLIVDPGLPENISEKLCEIASTGTRCLQLKTVDTEAMCTELLPKSIYSWCKEKSGYGWKWLPGQSSMPPQTWMDALWKWITEAKVKLSSMEGLPIIPQLPYDINHEGGVTLIEISKTIKMCRISSLFTSRQQTILLRVMKKLDFIIVDESKMNNCNGMKGHPDFEEFIPELSPHSDLIIKFLHILDRSSRLQAIQRLDNNEKDLLRLLFSDLDKSFVKEYQSCLRSIPVYHAAAGNELSPKFIPLSDVGGSNEAFLPPDNIPPLPVQPNRMLSSAKSLEEREFFKILAVKQLCLSDLCALHLKPLALEHIQHSPQSWSVGDEIVLWILRQQLQLPSDTYASLSHNKIILTRNSTRKKPKDVYDHQDQIFTLLFDVDKDKDYFPNVKYLEEAHCRPALLMMGITTWKKIQGDHSQMYNLLHDRMKSVCTLKSNVQLIRGKFILQTLAEPSNYELQQDTSLTTVPFLKAELCPQSYPSCLKEKWCGQPDKLYSIEELCPPNDNIHSLIGTVLPVLSHDYCLGLHAVTMNAFNKLAFRRGPNLELILKHLSNLKSVAISLEDTAKFDQIVMSVYEYINQISCGKKLNFIWWREKTVFLPAYKFVLDLPESLQVDLEPFYYHLRGPVRRHAQLFHLHNPLSLADAAHVIEEISKQAEGKLSVQHITVCVSILNWLYENKYGHEQNNMLMPTKEGTLLSACECVFDDREWMKHSNSRDHIMGKSLTFVHDQIPQKVAKHFNVIPLSSKVAPSQKLEFGILYTRAGQHEDITQRIRHIVQDYETNIDIFKELIQNADDARATEVKFLIDWRNHPKHTLFSKDLEDWQGPALIAYNDATFSEEDFENICSVAGETKKRDPLKTGRFGVGFCSTYHLTDVPSFISRNFFTMFDPHTSYLGNRITAQAPGMRVDLVENKADLKFYHDQFEPYDSIFHCDVFNLTGDGYQGTLFRFPFRCQHTSSESKICKTVYDRKMVSTLVQALREQSSELLLFLKHITKVSVYELETDRQPSAAKEIFSVQRSGSTDARIQLIRMASSQFFSGDRTCSTQFEIEVNNGNKMHLQKWLVSSAIKPLSLDMQRKPEAKGLLHLAEVALQIDSSKDSLKILPNTDSSPSKVFCFLPLPIQCKLPFHVNGFFSIGKDRRNVSATDDKTFGSMWNKSLAEGALVTAFVHILEYLRDECDRKLASKHELKAKFLRSYYSLWNMSGTSGLIDASFVAAFNICAPTLTCPLLWSKINGGCWLAPVSAYVFKDRRLKQKEKERENDSVRKVIAEDAISLLLKHGFGLVDVPYSIYDLLKASLKQYGRVYGYKRVCEELLFPNLKVKGIDPQLRDRNIKFLIERFGAYAGKDNWYNWAEHFIKTSPCILCQNSENLLPACKLIDPTNEHFINLFDVDEGRFPCKELQDSSLSMLGLKRLGMSSSRLSVDDLIGRAQSVTQLSEYDTAVQYSMSLCEYIDSTYSYRSSTSYLYSKSRVLSSDQQLEELKHLHDIPFLPVKEKPDDIDIPWKGKPKSFDSPSRVYASEREHLLFSQHPVVETSEKSLKLLGVSLKEIRDEMVIANLKCIISHIKQIPNDATIKFLDDSVQNIYSHLNSASRSSLSVLTMLQQLQTFIWQNGCFLSPEQVVSHWRHNCVPYLCELSLTNKRFPQLMERVGVKNEVTTEMLGEVLQKVAANHCHHDNTLSPISKEVLEFVVYTSGQLSEKLCLSSNEDTHSIEIYLPDENLFMRKASDLADNIACDIEWIKSLPAYKEFIGGGRDFYVHKSIPRQCAVTLGVKPLLDAVLKGIEDEDFLSGTDFGQHEDLCDRLNGILRKYPADVSIFKEFIQNADDAQATEIIFVLDRRTDFPDNTLLGSSSKWKSLQHTPALCVYNNRKFTEADIEGITKLGRGGKSQSVDLIGKFGIGFNVAYHVTDCPSFVSYSENGTPEYLCVFDPTKSFVPRNTKKCSPGRKWNFKDKDHYSGFSDQFRPYLLEDLPRLTELVPSCLKDSKDDGHVIFRLPLTRYSEVPNSQYTKKEKPSLSAGRTFSPYSIQNLFKKFSTISKDVLLFLNHLKSVSAFEIDEDGLFTHHFTTIASIPSAYLDNCRRFSQCLKQFSQTKQTMQRVSITHRVKVTHIRSGSDPDHEHADWLIQRVIGGSELPNEFVQAGLSQGLRPVGGVATLLKPPAADHKYLLFCFLPLPIQSNLPVHVNGHFLVDDSRKHLETIDHVGLSNWNEVLAHKLIVPAYVDLLIAVKYFIDVNDSGEVKFYYSLFPRESSDVSGTVEVSEEKKKVGELSDLNIVKTLYAELLRRNPLVLVHEVPDSSSFNPSWMNVKSSLFCVSYMCNNKESETILHISAKLHTALVALGLAITTAPSDIYYECVKVESSFSSSAAVEPAKIIEHLQKLICTSEQKEVIKENIIDLLQFCITGYDLSRIPTLFCNSLYLVAQDGSLQHGYLFKSTFSKLLPQCSNKFVDNSLENSKVSVKLIQCRVIRSLPMKFVSDNVNLSETKNGCPIGECNSDILRLLWRYFIHCSQVSVYMLYTKSESVPSQLKEYFSTKAIIPASDEKLYPVCLSKTLMRDTIVSCDNCCVMKKLGYPSIDFEKIKMSLSNETQQIVNNIVNEITSCFQAGEDIINCFQLRPPKTAHIELTEDEVLSFIATLGKVPTLRLKQVSTYLLEMPLFHTIDGLRISLQGVRKVFILASTDLPLEEIPPSHNGRVVLRPVSSESMKNFYDGVIPRRMSVYVSPEEFYMQLILPILQKLSEESVKAHVDYLHVKRDKMKLAYERLKHTPFIQRNGRFYKAGDLCHPQSEFYMTFKPDRILPRAWHNKIDELKNLDLQSEVSPTEWLQWAKRFSREVTSSDVKYKSTVLLNKLVDILHKRDYGSNFMVNVADVEFVYSPQEWELNSILSALFPENKSRRKRHRNMVKFRGSVSFHESNLACLCKPILPESCQQLINIYKNPLSVEFPASAATVAENLKHLCNTISATCARSQSSHPQNIDKLIQIFDAHYACLSKRRPPKNILRELSDTMCILPSKSRLLQLVKPSQLVMQLPSDCFLEPYCFKVESWLQRHVEFLTAVGVKDELKAQDYISILSSIKQEGKEESNSNDKDSRVINSVYKELISRLRRRDAIEKGDVVYLPDESLKLTIATELCLNDVPWYKNRLPPDCGFRMILPPPTDDKGHRTLPEILKIKRLSEIVTEELQESCKSSDFACNEEELFKIRKRSESKRCVFVKNILDTLKSDELCHGFCRMYFTEYRCPPIAPFKILLQRLKQLRVHCLIGELKSVLSIKGQPITGSEKSKLCHLSSDNDTFILYIAPHSKTLADGNLSGLFKDLALCISKLIDNEIKNMGPIAAVFGCYPNEIPLTLTREQIHEYSEEDYQVTKAINIGSQVHWSKFPAQECLLILNFDPDEPVWYISGNGTLINAEVVKGGQSGLLETEIVVKVRDTENDDEEVVSPLQVFKVLSASQKKSLWSGSISPYASPVALATLPAEDLGEFNQFLSKIRDFQLTHDQCGLLQSIQTLRLVCHLHYQLVVQKRDQTLFNKVAFEMRDQFCNAGSHSCPQTRMVLKLIASTIEKLTSQTICETTFPSKALGQVIESDGTGNFIPPLSTGDGHALSTGNYTASLFVHQSGGSSAYALGGSGQPLAQPQAFIPPLLGSHQSTTPSSLFSTTRRSRLRRGHQYPRYSAAQQVIPQQQPPPPPNTSWQSAIAWLEQAKADFNAAETLLGSCVLPQVEADLIAGESQCRFPALVCFLCHDTVEKCIKGVFYAFCGLRQDLINCSNLTSLHDILETMPHHPSHLMEPIKECVMTVNRHETGSRFPIYQHPPRAPATIYSFEDAKEAFDATSKFLRLLQSEDKLNPILQDLGQLPARRFMSVLQSMSDNEDYPDNWDTMKDGDEVRLFLLDPISESEEYERVTSQFLLTLPQVDILKVERVQNKVVWKRYYYRSQLMKDFDKSHRREELLFHGTRNNNPELIYKGSEGFDTRFSNGGLWGRGTYFAVNSSYSDSYAFNANGTRKMFAAWVLTGNSVYLKQNYTLNKPPPVSDPGGSSTSIHRRYDSVNGRTGGTRVYITYDNDHAYPAYLITYTN